MATHLLDLVDGNTSKILEVKVDFKGQYLSVLGFFSTCQRLVSYDSSMPASVGTFSSDTPLDRVSGLTSVQLESTAHGNLAESLFCLMWAFCQNNTRMEAMQLWENVRRSEQIEDQSHTFISWWIRKGFGEKKKGRWHHFLWRFLSQ